MAGLGNQSRRRPVVAGLAAALAVTICAPPPARADEAGEMFARYAGPVDRAISRGLEFLARRQDEQGAWHAGEPVRRKGRRRDERDEKRRDATAITSLCIMAFLSKGYTPGVGPYGKVLNDGIDFVTGSQQSNGLLVQGSTSNGPMYNHCISTLMLSEVSGMVDPERQEKIDRALPKALKVVLSAQNVHKDRRHQGGWRYQHTSRDSDMSVTGWALMALRSARNNGAGVPTESIDEAIRFIMNCRHGSGGFTYQPGRDPGLGRTGTALLCMELTGHHRSRASLFAGDWVLKNLPTKWGHGNHFCYAMYYASQGTFQLGGRYWERFGARMYDILLRAQEQDGSWPKDNRGGQDYSTAMSILAMSVSYRQLPIYQR